MTAVHQFVPTLAPHDAVSTHYLAVQDALRAAGYRSEIYAHEVKPALRRRGRHYRAYRGPRAGEPTWLCYHSSVGSPVGDFVLARDEPLLLDYHNITPAELFLRWEPAVAGQLSLGRRQLARLAPRARLGLADSRFNATELSALGCERTAVVPIMLDVSTLDRDADAGTARRLDAVRERGGANWLFVGRIAPNKAQHDVVKAFHAYRRFFDPRAELHLVGGSSSHRYLAALHDFVGALGLAGCVHLTGPVPDAQLCAYYRHSDVLVVCSDHEGFCLPLIEAMHAGLPVVAYAAAAVPETLGDGGLLLDTKEPCTVAAAVARVLRDDRLREQLVAAGRRRLGAFDVGRSRERLLEAVGATVGPP